MTTAVPYVFHAVGPSVWPAAPEVMSFSALREVEDCPRRWGLHAAEYPDLWARRGYPPRVTVASLKGEIVHRALETLVRALARAGCSTARSPEAVAVLKSLGGYSNLLTETHAQILARYADNPRAQRRQAVLARRLTEQLPIMRVELQSRLARLSLSITERRAGGEPPGDGRRRPLPPGTHSERELVAVGHGWRGRPDLIMLDAAGCRIVDFKTGKASPEHEEQVRVYAWLWWRDTELNPTSRTATRLVLSYPTEERDVPAPSLEELRATGEELRRRAADATAHLARREARPAAERCARCGVRQLCEDYWTALKDGRLGRADADEREASAGRDLEVRVVSRRGPATWDVVVLRGVEFEPGAHARLHVPREEVALDAVLRADVCVRLVGAFVAAEGDGDPLVITLNVWGEAFLVPSL